MTYSASNFIRCDELLPEWREDILIGHPPIRYELGKELGSFHFTPGTVAILGGAPGMGKTAFTMQCVVEAMLLNEKLRVCVANVEMPPERLLERQLSRLSGVRLDDIQTRKLNPNQKKGLKESFADLDRISERLVYVQSPMTLDNVANAADFIDADLIVLDYIQRIQPKGQHSDRRGSVDATMDSLRQFAAAGCSVLALSAVGRSKDSRGRSSYSGDGLSLASFRESSELEFGADDAYMLVPANGADADSTDEVVDVSLRQLKSRYGKPDQIDLSFNRSIQSFDLKSSESPLGALSSLWETPNEN